MQADVVNRRLVKFIWAAAIFFAWALIQGAIEGAVPSVHALTQAGPGGLITSAHTHVGLLGWMSLALMAAIYYVMPILSGKTIVWPRLIDWIFWIAVISGVAASILMIIGGVVGGSAFAAGVKGAQLEALVAAYAMPGGIMCTITAIAGLMFVVQILTSLARGSRAAVTSSA